MTDSTKDVDESELHALVDGQLEPSRIPAVLDWLQNHPEDAQRVAHWQAQRLQLRQMYRSMDVGETPLALTQTVMRAPRRMAGRQVAAAAVLLGVGLLGGWAGGRWSAGSDRPSTAQMTNAEPGFARDAMIAHAVYTPEVRHPVEVTAADEAHLVQWLTRRLGSPLKAPALGTMGYRLLGGRLLPGPDSPRAQFMYEDAGGRRVTLYVTVFDDAHVPSETAFRSVHEGKVESFYWIEGRLGYALSGEFSGQSAIALATEVYRQLSK